MLLVPAEIPITKPVELIEATPGLPEIHGLTVAGIPEPVNWVVDPMQTVTVSVDMLRINGFCAKTNSGISKSRTIYIQVSGRKDFLSPKYRLEPTKIQLWELVSIYQSYRIPLL